MIIIAAVLFLAYVAFCVSMIGYYVEKFNSEFVSLFLSLATFFVPIAIVFQICEWVLT